MSIINLYFIAIIPPDRIKENILALKEEIKSRFNAKHALKSPAHITLQMPFRKREEEEVLLIDILSDFSSSQEKFNIELNDFGCFTPRVIFVKIEDHGSVIELQAALRDILLERAGFEIKEVTKTVHPHMTIATRDLSLDSFQKAWPEFADRKFRDSFKVNSLFLLKHNGEYWDICSEFSFG